MSTIVIELYDALRAAGVSDEQAKAAAGAVIGGEGLATRTDLAVVKADLVAMMAGMETRIVRWNAGTIIAMTAVFAAIVKLL
jgi:hypothetical protein